VSRRVVTGHDAHGVPNVLFDDTILPAVMPLGIGDPRG